MLGSKYTKIVGLDTSACEMFLQLSKYEEVSPMNIVHGKDSKDEIDLIEFPFGYEKAHDDGNTFAK
jgi:hypothetical protein